MVETSQPALKHAYRQIDIDAFELFQQFDFYLQYGKKSDSTRRLYKAVLLRWQMVVGDVLNPSDTTLKNWIRNRRTCVGITTYNLDITALRTFYKWCANTGRVAADFCACLPRTIRAPQKLPRVLTEREIGHLLAAPDLGTLVGLRDHVMMRLAYETGITASELVALDIGCILPDGQLYIYPRRNAREGRRVPMSEGLHEALHAWLAVRRQTRPGKASRLFVTHRGRPFSQGRAVWEIVDKYARAAIGIGCGYDRITTTALRKPWSSHYPHLLRSSFAARLLQNNINLRAVQHLLGHQSIHTTERFLSLDVATLKREHGKLFKSESP